MSKPIPASLKDPQLAPLWRQLRKRLDKYGEDKRGTMTPPRLPDSAALTLASLLGRSPGARIDLAELEHALIAIGVGGNLDRALDRLGATASAERRAARGEAQRRREARARVDELIAEWMRECPRSDPSPDHWLCDWADWLFRSGSMADADADSASQLLANVRKLIAFTNAANPPLARNDLAARLYGSAHALDDGGTLERCTRRALWHQMNCSPDYERARAVWHAASISTDRVSTPVLCWRLPLNRQSALGGICHAASAADVPLHLSALALDNHPISYTPGAQPLLVVENPRLLEAAAERGLRQAMVTTNGNPSSTVVSLLQAAIDQGITVYYHGDFDSAGIAICRRMMALGAEPWHMNAGDYAAAIHKARDANVLLPSDSTACGDTPWDPALQTQMQSHRSVVHEEFLIDEILQQLN